MENSLDKKISLASLLKLTLPTVVMMVFFSLYSIVDGMFVSRFVGPNALSGLNIVYPIINLLIGISIMFATGGNAIVSKLIGEGRENEAREKFTLIVITAIGLGIVIALLTMIFSNKIIHLLGATKALYDYAEIYLEINLLFSPFIILKLMLDYFYVTNGKATLGLIVSVIGGVSNVILDYIFIVTFDMGISGAAIATGIGYLIPAVMGIIYFSKKSSLVHFTKTRFDMKVIIESSINGSSEMVTQIAASITTIMYNLAMLKYLGEAGVAAITVILYIQFLLSAAYIGFTSGVAPRIGYNYGAKNDEEIKNIVKYSYIIIFAFSIITFIISKIIQNPLTALFCGNETELYYITLNGFNLYSLSFLLCGFNIFTCGMFTAFSNGKVSAILSLLRTFIFFIIGMIILPPLLGVDGVWMIAAFLEVLSLIASIIAIVKYRKQYSY